MLRFFNSFFGVNIPVIGLEKDDKHTFRAIVYNNKEIILDKHSDLYLFLMNISQTVHDFAISFFRSQKGKGVFSSMLDGIEGVGPKKKEALLKKFVSIENIVNGTIDDFKEIGINESLRDKIIKHLTAK
jgi:excinuclease ABC subunit C